MTGDDRVGARRVTVVHDDEVRREGAVCALDREVPLVRLHRLLEDLARNVEERLVEVPDADRGPLDEVHDLGKRLLGNDRARAACGCRRPRRALRMAERADVGVRDAP